MNIKIRIKSNREGYSLIELLVVISLISVLGTLTAEAFILGIKAQSKSETLKEVKQNADYIGQVVENMVRNSIDVDSASCNRNSTDLTIRNNDGYYTTFDCSGQTMASISGQYPLPTTYFVLSNNRVSVANCNFRIVCPTPPVAPKYIFFNFRLKQAGENTSRELEASYQYQNTISLRNYQ